MCLHHTQQSTKHVNMYYDNETLVLLILQLLRYFNLTLITECNYLCNYVSLSQFNDTHRLNSQQTLA